MYIISCFNKNLSLSIISVTAHSSCLLPKVTTVVVPEFLWLYTHDMTSIQLVQSNEVYVICCPGVYEENLLREENMRYLKKRGGRQPQDQEEDAPPPGHSVYAKYSITR